MGTWLPAISITKAPLDVIQIGSHLIRRATSAEATGLGLFLISLRMSLSCLQHHRLRHCFLLRSYGPNAQLSVQGIASQVSGALTTQALLYADGLRKGVIPMAAAIKWVLKDGIGQFPTSKLSTVALPYLFPNNIFFAATRSCFYAGFAAQRNFAEVIAKGEAQGMVSKFIGIMLGIALACTGSSTSLALASFSLVRTSSGARYAAADIEQRLHLGSKLSDVVNNKNDVLALFNLYRDEGYILTEHGGRLCLRSKFFMGGIELTNSYSVLYLNYLQQSARSISADCRPGGRLRISLEYAQREFNHVKNNSGSMVWVTVGLIARPSPNRVCLGNLASSIAS
ncbi:hypothetical protein POTOM_011465 [Populus tomentosa]|uniref:Protein root UVB sensitive/RUS domain-containing protein n=1 Tax=Populus tomentosa TaxID=118781 RepID=A0A8X8D8W3_POPTO|nr:hypothetical protein POTOM_011465 [Populus tomentosa]